MKTRYLRKVKDDPAAALVTSSGAHTQNTHLSRILHSLPFSTGDYLGNVSSPFIRSYVTPGSQCRLRSS